MNSIFIREPQLEDELSFLLMTNRSKALHHPWVNAPLTHVEFLNYFNRYQQTNQKSFIVSNNLNHIIGVFNLSEIVYGHFQNAYLGFYVDIDYANKGWMSKGLKLVLERAFTEMALHRIEANIQPQNVESINLVKINQFRKEGFSQRYLNINNVWCDHERWAITFEDWQR
jgi:[ribosomal protein S5]-alanine N-acetyltransferase